MWGFIVDHVLFWLSASLLGMYAYMVVFHGAVPSIRTAPAIQRKIIELLKVDFAAKKTGSYTIVDLGSGNGHFTREIARALPAARVVGIELAWQSVQWANWRKRRAKLDNLEYKRMNLLKYDFSEADAFVIFQIPELLGSIGAKLHREAKVGALITSNKFRLGDGWVPDETLRVKTLYLHQGLLHVYRRRVT